MKPHYLIVFRESVNAPWSPWDYFCNTIEDAQKRLLNVSRGSTYHYDLWEMTSMVNRLVGEVETVSPEIVKERG